MFDHQTGVTDLEAGVVLLGICRAAALATLLAIQTEEGVWFGGVFNGFLDSVSNWAQHLR